MEINSEIIDGDTYFIIHYRVKTNFELRDEMLEKCQITRTDLKLLTMTSQSELIIRKLESLFLIQP